jgi:Tol biopolymer transport system component
MAFSAGTRVGSYEILASIGAGGMGEVYRARDLRLGRDVAIKILPEAFARDADRMARFEREAKVLASLNHPHIAAIYGLEESDGMRALVMELVEGPTLDEQIGGRAIALEETLPIAKQIAEALEYAHEKGIIHRDLKPANVKLTADGHVKVLDFGLAKAFEAPAPAVGNPSVSPTLTIEGTRAGVILGTAAYMAPEQARGTMLDKRADIWSFGVVLYEMLTGKQPFAGATVSDTLAAVLKTEPDLERVPPKVRRLIESCLKKDPKQRLRDIGDAWRQLEEAPQANTRVAKLPWTVAAAGILVALVLGFVHFREAPVQRAVQRYLMAAPDNTTDLHSFAISFDGRLVAMAAQVNGKRQLWLRPLNALQAQPLPGTEDATYPFWSPDSRYIGFFAQGRLKKIAASGGPSQSLCDVTDGLGGSWNRDNVILFAHSSGGVPIQRVSAAGGIPADVTGRRGLPRFPVFLPDGRHFLYTVSRVSMELNGVYMSSLDDKENRRVLADVSGVVFAAGHLLFIRDNTLVAHSFDSASGQTKGEVFPVAEGVALKNISYAPVTVSENGVLLFESGRVLGNSQMAWYDRRGKLLEAVGAPGPVGEPAISPDEKSVVFRRNQAVGADLWLRDLARGNEQRFTSDPSYNAGPFWSPQGDLIVFGSIRGGANGNLYQKVASGAGQDELVLTNGNTKFPTQWSRDGRFIVYRESNPKTKLDIWVLPVEGSGQHKPFPFLHSDFNELHGQLSPDSNWMAYTSDESGQREVYVRPFPGGEFERHISIAGGEQPRWRGDGKELFFVGADEKMMAVPVKAMAGSKLVFEPGVPQQLFEAHLITQPGIQGSFEYDVTKDGKRFLLATTRGGSASTSPLTAVVNWDAGLQK